MISVINASNNQELGRFTHEILTFPDQLRGETTAQSLPITKSFDAVVYAATVQPV